MKIRFWNLLMGVLAVLVITNCKNKDKNKDTATDSIPQEVVADIPQEPAVDSSAIIAAQEADSIKKDNQLQSGVYYVIGGSFKEMARAEKFQNQLSKKGYQAQVLKPWNEFNRVAVKSFEDEASARKDLAELRKSFGDVTFWLLVP